MGEVLADPRLVPRSKTVVGEAWSVARVLVPLLLRHRLPGRVLAAWRHPDRAPDRLARAGAAMLALDVEPGSGAEERIAVVERLLLRAPPRMVSRAIPVFAAGLLALSAATRLLDDLASPDELEAVRRGLPHNPTTEMDLELWAVAERVRQDATAAEALRAGRPGDLAKRYRNGALPPPLQQGLANFLSKYGHRGVAEIDLGLPRWSDDPAHLLCALANYLQVEEAAQAPAAAFAAAARRAEEMAEELARRAARRGRLRGRAERFLLGRARALSGMREAPKFHFATVLAKARVLLASVGTELAASGRLDTVDDVYFLTLPELRDALTGVDLRPTVGQRRVNYERELRRRHVPRILLSDGTEPEAAVTSAARGDTLQGAPASAGVTSGKS